MLDIGRIFQIGASKRVSLSRISRYWHVETRMNTRKTPAWALSASAAGRESYLAWARAPAAWLCMPADDVFCRLHNRLA